MPKKYAREGSVETVAAANTRMCGYLEKKGKMKLTGRWRKVWCVLDGPLLLYYKSRADYLKLSPCSGSVNMAVVISANIDDSNHIVINTHCQIIVLRTKNEEIQLRWFNALRDAMPQSAIDAPNAGICEFFNFPSQPIPKIETGIMGNNSKGEKVRIERVETSTSYEKDDQLILTKNHRYKLYEKLSEGKCEEDRKYDSENNLCGIRQSICKIQNDVMYSKGVRKSISYEQVCQIGANREMRARSCSVRVCSRPYRSSDKRKNQMATSNAASPRACLKKTHRPNSDHLKYEQTSSIEPDKKNESKTENISQLNEEIRRSAKIPEKEECLETETVREILGGNNSKMETQLDKPKASEDERCNNASIESEQRNTSTEESEQISELDSLLFKLKEINDINPKEETEDNEHADYDVPRRHVFTLTTNERSNSICEFETLSPSFPFLDVDSLNGPKNYEDKSLLRMDYDSLEIPWSLQDQTWKTPAYIHQEKDADDDINYPDSLDYIR